jgi:hypothetical protein
MLRSIYRTALPLLTIVLILAACSSSKVAVAKKSDVKGNWVLNNVSSSERIKLTLLDEGSDACLQGSTWSLPNNGYGSYTIANNASCTAGERKIIWSYQKDGSQPMLQFKKLQEGVKAKNVEEGYRFKIISASGNSMVLQSEITNQGHPIYITYTFSKI